MYPDTLTHLSRMEIPTLINWTSAFVLYGLLGDIFHYYSKYNRAFNKQTVEILIQGESLFCGI